LFYISNASADEVIFNDSIDEWGNWSADSGVWEVGVPASGPGSAKEGTGCAGTQLSGNYLPDTDSHLISPSIKLPLIENTWEQLIVSFDTWYDYMPKDYGQLKIQVYNTSWSSWSTLINKVEGNSNGWYNIQINLNKYAGSKIKLGFYHTADSNYEDGESTGWYIDNLNLKKKTDPFFMPEGFESGLRGWNINQGQWEIGSPSSGPGSANSGSNCIATNLNGSYDSDTDSNLISPPVYLPEIEEDEEISLRFWHWFAYESRDEGQVLIRSWDDRYLRWGSWSTLDRYNGESGTWSRAIIDITKYEGQNVQIGFNHTADSNYEDGENSGWYIDDIEISPGGGFSPLIQNFQVDKESGFIDMSVTFSVDAQEIDGSIVSYSWDWDGDGTIDEKSTTSSVTHQYSSSGFYTPLVGVEDDDGKVTWSENLTITVNNSDNTHTFDDFSLGDLIADYGYGNKELDDSLTNIEGDKSSISLGEESSYESLLLLQWIFEPDLSSEPFIVNIRHQADTYFNENSSVYSLNLIFSPPVPCNGMVKIPASDSSSSCAL